MYLENGIKKQKQNQNQNQNHNQKQKQKQKQNKTKFGKIALQNASAKFELCYLRVRTVSKKTCEIAHV